MPYTMADFEREVEAALLSKLPPDRFLARLSLTQRLEGLTPEQILEWLPRGLPKRVSGTLNIGI